MARNDLNSRARKKHLKSFYTSFIKLAVLEVKVYGGEQTKPTRRTNKRRARVSLNFVLRVKFYRTYTFITFAQKFLLTVDWTSVKCYFVLKVFNIPSVSSLREVRNRSSEGRAKATSAHIEEQCGLTQLLQTVMNIDYKLQPINATNVTTLA